MTPDLQKTIDELKALAAKATTGPLIYCAGDRFAYTRLTDGCRGIMFPGCEADLAYIVAAVNALPGLIAELEAAGKVVEAAREWRKGKQGLPSILRDHKTTEQELFEAIDALSPNPQQGV